MYPKIVLLKNTTHRAKNKPYSFVVRKKKLRLFECSNRKMKTKFPAVLKGQNRLRPKGRNISKAIPGLNQISIVICDCGLDLC